MSTGMNMITFPDPVGNGLLAQEDETGEYLLYHFNNIGSTSAVTDMDGTIVHAYSYGTYGELLSGNREGIRFLYNGSYGVVTDENVLYYMWARYYNVDIKRFINQDVVEGSIATSPSLNQYAYCQGNPVKLTDPFGLSPFTSWSVLGHGLLDVLGFIPVIGAIPDTVNALWYLAEGDHFSAAASFVSAVPGWGDVIGAVGKTAKGCSKVSKMVRYGSKIVGRIGNIALGSYQTGSIAVSLYDKHVVQGESWDWDSTVQLFSAGLFATTTVVSAKGLKGDVGEYRRVVGSKVNFDNETMRSGAEWNEYFKRKYGAENVGWNFDSIEDVVNDPIRLKKYTADELEKVLGSEWKKGVYGRAGGGWKFLKDDISLFYHPGGGRHNGSYYGISTATTGKIKVVNSNTYTPLSGDKATIIYEQR